VNTGLPYFMVQRVTKGLSDHNTPLDSAKILVLGLAYKKDVDNLRESPTLKIMDLLKQEGAEVSYNNPHIPKCGKLRRYPNFDIKSTPLIEKVLHDSEDLVLLVTDHSAYDYPWLASQARLIFFTRNAFKGQTAGQIYQA
jgi:UDP-N-acetyl-D-glucosamine dehydrogenase